LMDKKIEHDKQYNFYEPIGDIYLWKN
jgi:hypothetical protein